MTSEDKRKHQRIPSLNLSYICLDENNNIVKQGMGRTLNLSESGILLETHFPIELEYLVLMTIALKEDLLEIKGSLEALGAHLRLSLELENQDQEAWLQTGTQWAVKDRSGQAPWQTTRFTSASRGRRNHSR